VNHKPSNRNRYCLQISIIFWNLSSHFFISGIKPHQKSRQRAISLQMKRFIMEKNFHA